MIPRSPIVCMEALVYCVYASQGNFAGLSRDEGGEAPPRTTFGQIWQDTTFLLQGHNESYTSIQLGDLIVSLLLVAAPDRQFRSPRKQSRTASAPPPPPATPESWICRSDLPPRDAIVQFPMRNMADSRSSRFQKGFAQLISSRRGIVFAISATLWPVACSHRPRSETAHSQVI